MKTFKTIISFGSIGFLSLILFSCETIEKEHPANSEKEEVILVEYPEVYELANIIIALTEDGINDKWKVNKDFPYYEEMRTYFKSMEGHPVLDSTNFIRERWEEFLSFRTDAYAYQFDENDQLIRKNDFYAFGISEFDDHISLVQDFADQSNFRVFYKKNNDFRQKMINGYKRHYMLNEMMEFLSSEFDNFLSDSKFVAVLSPFVGSQHLLRTSDSTTTASFADIAKPILNDTVFTDEAKSANIHTLFTEMDHAFVNPTSADHKIDQNFDHKIWNNGSGYEEYENGVFNEYMTWAVFDIFNSIYFPEIADRINLNWHFQNETRGFIYSNLFAQKLKELHHQYQGKKKLKDLYPELLSWTKEIQSELTKPKLLNNEDTLILDSKPSLVKLQFSEPMQPAQEFEIVLQFGSWDREIIKITNDNKLNWQKDGMGVSFEIELPSRNEYYLLLNWWDLSKPLKSKKGVLLTAASGLIVKAK